MFNFPLVITVGVSSLMMVLRNTVGRYQGRFSRTKSQILRRDYLLLRMVYLKDTTRTFTVLIRVDF